MKILETILTVFMVAVGFLLVLAYAADQRPFLALLWAIVAAVNVSTLTLKGVVFFAERKWK